MSYKIYYYSEIEVCNGSNIKVLKELIEFNKKYRIIVDFLSIEYGYANEYLLHLNKEEINNLLNIIENKKLFDFMSRDYWINEYGNYFYDYIKYDKYVMYNPKKDKDLFYTKEELIEKFLKELIDEIMYIKNIIEYDNINDFYIGWK